MTIIGGCEYCGSVGHTSKQHEQMSQSAAEAAASVDENGQKIIEPIDLEAIKEARQREQNMIEYDFGPAGRMLVPKEQVIAERGGLPGHNQPQTQWSQPVAVKPEDYWPEGTYVFCFKCGTKVPIPLEITNLSFQPSFISVEVKDTYNINHVCGGGK